MFAIAHKTDMKISETGVFSVCRMCIACRKTFIPKQLLRFVKASDGQIHFDAKAKVQQRAAYVCSRPECLKNAVLRKAFNRAFKSECKIDFLQTNLHVKEVLLKAILENLGLAFRASQCIVGREKILKEGIVNSYRALIMSCDLSNRSTMDLKLSDLSKNGKINMLKGPPKILMGQALGRSETGVVALLKGRISDRVLNDLIRWQSLCEFSIL